MRKIDLKPLLMNLYWIRYILPVMLVTFALRGEMQAQELSKVGKSPFLTANGGISLNQVFFHSSDTSSSRVPYAYTFSANMNFAFYGWSVPVSILYSNKEWNYSQPFNQFSFSPSYKWIKLMIGNSSMTFSPYTLSGHQFLGGGAELTPPGKFSISMMGGRLQKRVIPNVSNSIDPAFQRYGGGFKTSYALPFGSLTAIAFYAKDDSSSLRAYKDSITVYPQENLCLGFSGNVNVLHSISATFDYGLSTLTENLYSPKMDRKFSAFPFFTRRESSHQYQAIKSSLNYNSPLGSLGVAYERVEPGYVTLGAYYSNNDFVNYTLNYASSILKNKVTMAGSYGVQKDDISGEKDQKTTRTIENLNVGFNPVDKVNLALYYTNFNNYTHVKSVFDDINTTSPYANLDTLSYTQISESMGGSASITLGDKGKTTHRVSLNGVYQKASQEQAGTSTYAGTKLYTASGGYSLGLASAGFSPSLMVNYSRNNSDTTTSETIGPSLNLRKGFFERSLNVGLMVSYNRSLLNGVFQGENTIIRASATYVVQKKHNFNLSSATAVRHTLSASRRTETTVTLTYGFNFGWRKGKEEK
jgi:hypothetical protein